MPAEKDPDADNQNDEDEGTTRRLEGAKGRARSRGNGSAARSPRTKNTLQVLDVLQRKAGVTQLELVEDTELSRATVAGIIRRLHDRRLIEGVPNSSRPRGENGRPPGVIRLRQDAALSLSVAFGLRHVDVALGNLSGIVKEKSSDPHRPIDMASDSAGALEEAVRLVEEVMGGVDPRDLVGVCVGFPAPIDKTRPQLASTRGIESWIGIRPSDELQRRLGPAWAEVPFALENEANLAALAEFEFGRARRDPNAVQDVVLVVKWSDGIGAAILVDGELLVGSRGLAVEFGHTVIADRPGDPGEACPRCGKRCLELLASGDSLKRALGAGDDRTFGEIVLDAVEADGPERRAVREAAKLIGKVLGRYVTGLNPRLIVISGRHFDSSSDGVHAYRMLADPLRAGMHETGYTPSLEDVDIVLGGRGGKAAAEGGVITMMRRRLPDHLERKLAQAVS